MNLTTQDYKTILNYYNISHKSKTNTWIKRNAEDILANKLCRCIKKVKKQSKLIFCIGGSTTAGGESRHDFSYPNILNKYKIFIYSTFSFK